MDDKMNKQDNFSVYYDGGEVYDLDPKRSPEEQADFDHLLSYVLAQQKKYRKAKKEKSES